MNEKNLWPANSLEDNLQKSESIIIVSKVTKKPTVISKQLKAFLALANVNVHKSTISRALNNTGVHGMIAQRKPLLSKKNITADLQFAKDRLDKPGVYGNNVFVLFFTDKTRIELFGLNEKYGAASTAFHH